MRLAKGPRPWSIWLFGLLLLVPGLSDLVSGLMDIARAQAQLSQDWPGLDWNRDAAIVASSALFTIICIPVVAVVGFASHIARMLVTIAALASVIYSALQAAGIVGESPPDREALAAIAIGVLAAALLFTPSARRWLHQGEAYNRGTYS